MPLGTQKFSPALGRKSLHLAQTFDPHALAAWIIRVITLALSESLPACDQAKLSPDYFSGLVKLSYFKQGSALAKEFLNKAGGIHLIIEKHHSASFRQAQCNALRAAGETFCGAINTERLAL